MLPALVHYNGGRVRQAERFLRACAERGEPEACLWLAELLRSLRRDGEAAAFYRRALGSSFAPSGPEGEALRALTAIRAHIRLKQHAKAFSLAERLLDAAPTQRVLEGFIGMLSPWTSDYSRLREDVDGVLAYARRRPAGPWPAYLAVDALDKLGRTSEALTIGEGLKRLPRRYGWMRWKVGMLRLNSALDYGGAAADFRAALRSRPGMWQAHGHLAEIELCLGRPRRGLEIFGRLAGSLTGWDLAEARTWRGEVLLWLGRAREALPDLDAGVAAGARFASGWRGAALLLLGRPREALAELDRACGIDRHDTEARVWRCQARRRLGMWEQAIEDVSSEEWNFWSRFNEAVIHLRFKRTAAARAALTGIPPEVRGFFRFRPSWTDPGRGAQTPEVSFLEDCLARARGMRRCDPYLFPIWMRAKQCRPSSPSEHRT